MIFSCCRSETDTTTVPQPAGSHSPTLAKIICLVGLIVGAILIGLGSSSLFGSIGSLESSLSIGIGGVIVVAALVMMVRSCCQASRKQSVVEQEPEQIIARTHVDLNKKFKNRDGMMTSFSESEDCTLEIAQLQIKKECESSGSGSITSFSDEIGNSSHDLT